MSGDDSARDEPGDKPVSPRRSRRADRTSDGTYDFSSRFGHLSPGPDVPGAGSGHDQGVHETAEGLREPQSRGHYVRGRDRLTVRELMEQMRREAERGATPPPAAPGPAPAEAPPIERTQRRHPSALRRDGGPADGDAPAEAPTTPAAPPAPSPRVPGAPIVSGAPDVPEATAALPRPTRPLPPVRLRPFAKPPAVQPPLSDRPSARQPSPVEPSPAEAPPTEARPAEPATAEPATTEHTPAGPASTVPVPAGPLADELPPVDATAQLPPVAQSTDPVDLSDAATAARVVEESRGQLTDPAVPRPAPSADTETYPSAGATSAGATDDQTSAATTTAAAAPRKKRRPLEPTGDLNAALTGLGSRLRTRRTGRDRTRTVFTVFGRTVLSLAVIVSLVATGYVWQIYRGWDGWNIVSALNPGDANIRDAQAQRGDENYLIVGTDSRAGNNSKLGGGDTTEIEGIRSDTVLLVHIPADRSRVVAVSWPRDLQVDRPDCDQWNPETGDYGDPLYAETDVKLNSVYAFGGPSCLVKTIQDISGLHINHFIAMDFIGFEKVVQAVGGVKVCSTVPLYDYELGYILPEAGTKTLNGRKALNYVRARNVSVEGNGDYGRIKRQQKFMASLLRSMLSSDVIQNPAKLDKIVNTFIRYSTVDNINTQSLIELAESMQDLDAGRVTFVTIPTTGTSEDGQNNELPDTEAVDALFDAIIYDQPLPQEKPRENRDGGGSGSQAGNGGTGDAPQAGDDDGSSNTQAADGSRVTATAPYAENMIVRVLNGSGEPGLASTVSDQLNAYGIYVPGIADASVPRSDTVVRYGAGEQATAAAVAKMFPGAKIQEDSTVRVGVEVIIGSDFGGVDTMNPLPSPGSTVTVSSLPRDNRSNELPNDLSITNAGDTTCD